MSPAKTRGTWTLPASRLPRSFPEYWLQRSRGVVVPEVAARIEITFSAVVLGHRHPHFWGGVCSGHWGSYSQ